MRRVVEAARRADRLRLVFKAETVEAERGAGGLRLHVARNGRRDMVEGDALLVATGRVPNIGDLDPVAAGVAVGEQGVVVDDRLARLVLANALFFGRGRASRLVVPWCTYTSPEVARVGLTAHDATRPGAALTASPRGASVPPPRESCR
jgi:pyruvate/2-oxoglutarate dehydrogenase complex dihydrolipoamide dehydrogenase (E3) component